MIRKPSGLALVGIALLCATVLAACSSSPTLRYIVVAPTNGTIYVSAPSGGAIRGARRAPARSPRRAAVSPQDITTAVCGSLQYAATAYYSDGSTQDQSSAVTWSSSSTSVATINSTGLASGVGLGFTNIGSTLASISATAVQLEVDQLNSITVAPVAPVINPLPVGLTQQFSGVGNFTLAAGGSVSQDISTQLTWATGNANIATTDQTGLVTAVAQGTTTLTATSCDGITMGMASVTVTGAVPTTLVITPSTITASTGTTVQYTAVEQLSDGTTQPAQNLNWSSNATSVASINASTGLAQALTASSTAVTITASDPANTAIVPGTASLTVQAAAARFAYVANVNGGAGTGSISSYIVDVTSSTPLTPNTNDPDNPSGNVSVASNPQQVLLHPSGDLLFYIDSVGGVHSYFVNSATGVFSTPTGQPVTAATNSGGGGDIYAGVIDPTGRFLYVISEGTEAGNGNGVVYGFTITHTQPSGGTNDAQLTPISGVAGFNDGTINAPTWILTDQTGNYLYVVNNGTNTVSEYSISQASGTLGQLTALGNSPVATMGTSPQFATTDVNGHLFVANEGNIGVSGQSVSAFTIGGTAAGELTLIGSGPTAITGATDTINVITSPSGNYLYVLDYGNPPGAGQVFTYGLTSSTGVIGSVIGTAQTTDIQPTGMAIDPTGVLLAIDNATGDNISLYSIGSNGAPTPTSPATVSAGANPEFVVFYTAASGQ